MAACSGDGQTLVRIGVLAKRGLERTHIRWDPLAARLSDRIPGHCFRIAPLGFMEVPEAVKNRRRTIACTPWRT